MVTIIWWIIIGLLAGVIAKAIMPGKDPGGFIVTVLLGIVGAIIGGWVGRMLEIGGPARETGDPGFFVTLLFAVIGSLIVLAVYRLLTKKSIRTGT
jgi:uncharacterized membrane protein YeaQ/YmgE (transglycosylase-associated protein family)